MIDRATTTTYYIVHKQPLNKCAEQIEISTEKYFKKEIWCYYIMWKSYMHSSFVWLWPWAMCLYLNAFEKKTPLHSVAASLKNFMCIFICERGVCVRAQAHCCSPNLLYCRWDLYSFFFSICSVFCHLLGIHFNAHTHILYVHVHGIQLMILFYIFFYFIVVNSPISSV